MKKNWFPVFIFSCAALLSLSSTAQNFALPESSRLLSVEQAFGWDVRTPESGVLEVHVRIVPGHYLYRDKLSVVADSMRVHLAFPELPPAEEIYDEFFGQTRIYRNDFSLNIPVSGNLSLPFGLHIRYQGCSEKPAVCYPPQELRVNIQSATAVSPQSAALQKARPAAAPVRSSAQQDLADRLAGSKAWQVLLSFLGLGFLLALTPCVLPLLPTLAVLVGGVGSGRKALALSSVYVVSLSSAYALAGVLAALLGAALQPWLQNPLTLGLTAGFFLLLALAMFGVGKLQLPMALRDFLEKIARSRQRGSFSGAVLLGIIGALVLSPCVSPPLIAALLYIGAGGNPLLGGTALFLLGIGMGIPLLLFGTAAAHLLPSSGPWMLHLRRGMGFVLLGIGLWLGGRFLPEPLPLLLLGLMFFAAGLWLWSIVRHWIWRSVSLGLLFWGVLLLQGAAVGGGSLLHPLQGLAASSTDPLSPFVLVSDSSELRRQLDNLPQGQKGAMLELYADWCLSCKEMEHQVFSDSEVQQELESLLLLRADLSDNLSIHGILLKELGLFGPPALLFFDSMGREIEGSRLIGMIPSSQLIAHVQDIFS